MIQEIIHLWGRPVTEIHLYYVIMVIILYKYSNVLKTLICLGSPTTQLFACNFRVVAWIFVCCRPAPMLFECWATVYDAGPALNHHSITVWCLLSWVNVELRCCVCSVVCSGDVHTCLRVYIVSLQRHQLHHGSPYMGSKQTAGVLLGLHCVIPCDTPITLCLLYCSILIALYPMRYTHCVIPIAIYPSRYTKCAIPIALYLLWYAHGAIPNALYPLRYTYCDIPMALYQMRYTHCAIPIVIYPWRYTKCAIPIALYLLWYTHGAIPNALYPLRYAYCDIPMALYQMRYTYCAIPIAIYLLRYTQCAIPVELYVMRFNISLYPSLFMHCAVRIALSPLNTSAHGKLVSKKTDKTGQLNRPLPYSHGSLSSREPLMRLGWTCTRRCRANFLMDWMVRAEETMSLTITTMVSCRSWVYYNSYQRKGKGIL